VIPGGLDGAHSRQGAGGRTVGKLMKKIGKYAKSPEAKKFEEKMLRKAKDPKTRARISKKFKEHKAKH
jgi:hypothetical protein